MCKEEEEKKEIMTMNDLFTLYAFFALLSRVKDIKKKGYRMLCAFEGGFLFFPFFLGVLCSDNLLLGHEKEFGASCFSFSTFTS